ncbi:MAG: hypothetical protein WED10_14820 [Brumimicrobium sp.]
MRRFLLFLIIPFLFTCAKEQPKTAWLILNEWDLNKNPNVSTGAQGEMTHALTQAFVNMDGKMLGVFSLPAKIPVVGEGDHDFIIIPGVKNNGISATKKRYPFLEQFAKSINLKVNDTVSVTPTTQYFEELQFHIEDFESTTFKFDTSEESTAELKKGNDPEVLKWGNYYGEIILNDQDSLISIISTFGESLPKQAAEVYLELDFMNTNSAVTSVISYGNGTYFNDPNIQLNPQNANEAYWKHIYIDLKEIISTRNTSPINEIALTAVIDELGTEKYVYIDNVKIIHF